MHAASITNFVVVSMILFATSARAEQITSLGFPSSEGTFAVIGGKPYMLRKGERGGPGNAVDIKSGGRLVHFASNKPLVYPFDGESTVVTLGDADNVSDVWDFSLPEGPPGNSVRAAKGKFRGWYLDWSETEIEIASGGATLHARQLILVKDPKPRKRFFAYPVAK